MSRIRVKHIHVPCHVISETEQTIRFVRAHSKELIDAINEVCDVAQTLLNHGASILCADVYKLNNGEFKWTLSFDASDYYLTKDGIIPASDLCYYTMVWSLVMERSESDPTWNDHYYSDPLPYDSGEVEMAVELIQTWAEIRK